MQDCHQKAKIVVIYQEYLYKYICIIQNVHAIIRHYDHVAGILGQ